MGIVITSRVEQWFFQIRSRFGWEGPEWGKRAARVQGNLKQTTGIGFGCIWNRRRSLRNFVSLGAAFGFLAVALGAFGAHALKQRLEPDMLDVFEVGVRYHMYHALALVGVGLAGMHWPGSAVNVAGWLFVAGILIFSGSLYILTMTGIRWLGAITPIGGLIFLAGWVILAWHAWKSS
jgi:uncharacterized membrane protein YgdD (TMEM256/DUF423 family)